MDVRNQPKVTVFIAVYNGEQYISNAIDSVLAQTFTDYELLLIDDHSSDDSVNIIKSYKDPRIRLVCNEKNHGIPKVHNQGVQLANSTYIAMLDHDDEAHPERIARQVAFLDAHADYALIGTWSRMMDEKGKNFGAVKQFPISHEEIQSKLLFQCCVLHPTILARQEVLKKFDYREHLSISDDYDIFVRISRDHKIGNIPEPLVRHRRHGTRTTLRKADMKKGENLKIFEEQLVELGVVFSPLDVERHYTISRMRALGFTPDEEYVRWAEGWFLKLHAANQQTKMFSHDAFGKTVGTMWFKVCWNASRRGTWQVWKRFARSTFCKMAWEGLKKDLSARFTNHKKPF